MKRRALSRPAAGLGRSGPLALSRSALASRTSAGLGRSGPLALSRTALPSRTSAGLGDVQNNDDAANYTPSDAELRAMGVTRARWGTMSPRDRFLAARRGASGGDVDMDFSHDPEVEGSTSEDDDGDSSTWEAVGHAVDRGLEELGDYLDRESRERLAQIRADADRTIQQMRGASAAEVERIRAESQRAHDEAMLEIAHITAQAAARREAGGSSGSGAGSSSSGKSSSSSGKSDDETSWQKPAAYVVGGVAVVALLALAVKAMTPKPPPPFPPYPAQYPPQSYPGVR